MTTQTEMFPKTELDEATAVLSHLMSEQEKAITAADNADQKARDAETRVLKQQHVIAMLQSMMPAAEPFVEGEAESDDMEDAEILQIEGDVLDPITGEVVGKSGPVSSPLAEGLEPLAEEMLAELAAEGVIATGLDRPCPTCDGDGRPFAKDGSRNGNAKCKMCDGTGRIVDNGASVIPCVVVLYPGDDEPHVTEVGPLTRYSELVADYLAAAGIDAEVDPYEWAVFAERELTHASGGGRNVTALIQERDHGHRLIVAAHEQGSVTGAPADVDPDYEAARDESESAA